MVRAHGGQPLAVEAADPGGNGLIVAAPDQTSRGGVAGAISNRQQSTGAVDFSRGGTLRTTEAGEFCALVCGERAQGIFLVT